MHSLSGLGPWSNNAWPQVAIKDREMPCASGAESLTTQSPFRFPEYKKGIQPIASQALNARVRKAALKARSFHGA